MAEREGVEPEPLSLSGIQNQRCAAAAALSKSLPEGRV